MFVSDVNMVRKYIKTTNRANINGSDVAAAINDITNGNCSLRNAAATYGIHFATLQYRLNLFRQKHQTIVEQPVSEDGGEENNLPHIPLPPAIAEVRELSKYSTRQVFSVDQEAQLEGYLIKCSKMQYGLTSKQLREFAFKHALGLKLSFPPSWGKTNVAGLDWLPRIYEKTP